MEIKKYEDNLKEILGWHYIAEIYTDKKDLLNDPNFIKQMLISAANAAKVTIIDVKAHQFTPHGVTGYLLLSESHISIHTWPEYGYAAVDVFTCGGEPEEALKEIYKLLEVKKYVLKKHDRGLF